MIGNFVRLSQGQLDTIRKRPEAISDFLHNEAYRQDPHAEHLDIDKTWQIIHFLLTGDPFEGEPPLCDVVLGGATLGEEDVGYGPARYLMQDEVQRVAAAVEHISETTLWERFDADRVAAAEIYPEGWTAADSEYVLSNFTALKQFYAAAAKHSQAVLQFIN